VLFLALVAVFSFYLAFSGYRATRLKELARGGSAKSVDWIAALICFAASACLAGFGAFRPVWVQRMGVVAIVFGIIGMQAAGRQMWLFVRKPTEKMFWWYTHLGNFIGSYIAAWTAFSVVTLPSILPHAGKVLWLWPTVVGVPAYYKRKFAPRAKVVV
jgi:steroid 5-alpha reductase family enzyme